MGALLSPWANLQVHKGVDAVLISSFDGSQAQESRAGPFPASDKGWQLAGCPLCHHPVTPAVILLLLC